MNDSPDILKKILDRKKEEIAERSQRVPLRELSRAIREVEAPRGFVEAIDARLQIQQPAVIAEIKKASPSKGILRENFYPTEIAESYQRNGAACLSVLTDKTYFLGSEHYLQQAREACSLPILRKDFIINDYQVYESRAIGADCILLIVAALGDTELHDLAELAKHLGMDVLVEVHNQVELERALSLSSRLVGVNNRNLHTFNVDLNTSIELSETISKYHKRRIIVSESGIHSTQDINLLQRAGINAFLVGEAFMRAEDPGEALFNLFH